MVKRDIGAVFIGRLAGPARLGDLKDSLKGTPKLMLDVIIEAALAAAMPLYAAKHTWASRASIIERVVNGS
jgi:hypothetical protein